MEVYDPKPETPLMTPIPDDEVLPGPEESGDSAVKDTFSFPVVEKGDPDEEGIPSEAFLLIEDIINTDIEYGFPGAQVAVIRHGKLVYERGFGRINAYLPDGSVNEDSPLVTTDTLYDLASVTKVFAVNYAVQKMVTDGDIALTDRICDLLGDGFYEDTLDFSYSNGVMADLSMQKKWKSGLTVRDLLCHEGGFPADPRYQNPYVDAVEGTISPENDNILFAGNDATPATRDKTLEMIFKTPLMYEPRTQTVYSDVDYMVLGFVVEKVSGMSLDEYIRTVFCEPIGLTHITFRPEDHGFTKEDCAATELNGNTRDGIYTFPGVRTETIQGEVHDGKAYYCMAGVSGHAGLFANASDLAKLAYVMLSGGYGDTRFFSRDVIDEFTSPKNENDTKWGLGWWRQGHQERTTYFGTGASQNAFGHQGWTGTFVMVDPERDIVIAILTNKINTRITPGTKGEKFNGNWYTTASLGFVAEVIYSVMDTDSGTDEALRDVITKIRDEAKDKVPKSAGKDHPAVLNLKSKEKILSMY